MQSQVFLCCLMTSSWLSISSFAQKNESSSAEKQKSEDATLVKNLLNEDLGSRVFSFATVVESSSGKRIIAYDAKNAAHVALKEIINQSCNAALAHFNKADSPIKGLRRINEASRFFEDYLKKAISAQKDFSCEIPKNHQGKEQRSGYPDLLIIHRPSQTKAYLDPKLFEAKSEKSTLRTFYFEPKTKTMKIQHNALHFLLGIKHDGKDGDWTFTDTHLVDISKLKVRLKAEFQASNRELYNDVLIIK